VSKKKLLIIVFLTLFALGGITYLVSFREPSITNGTPEISSDPLRNLMDSRNRKILEGNDKITQRAIGEENISLCKKSKGYFEVDIPISKEYAIDKCYASCSIAINDIQGCGLIDNIELKSACLFKVAKATGSLTPELCEGIKGNSWYFAECIAEVVDETGDFSVCDKYFRKHTGDWNRCTSGPILK